MTPMERQEALEKEYSDASILAGIQKAQEAISQGRVTEISAGKRLIAAAFPDAVAAIQEVINAKTKGIGGKYRGLIRRTDIEVVTVATLRIILNACATRDACLIQDLYRNIGKVVEHEALLAVLTEHKKAYTERTLNYLDTRHTTDQYHRYRTMCAAAENVGLSWEHWSAEERIGCGRLIMDAVYEATGLFQWTRMPSGNGKEFYAIEASPALARVLQDAVDAARAIVKFPPMLVKPMPWVSQWDGGYLTEWMRDRSRMCSLRYMSPAHRKWILTGLKAKEAQPLRDAMNRAQSVPYRVDGDVLELLGKALATGRPLMGLPKTVPEPKPHYPFEGIDMENPTPEVAEEFKIWKRLMVNWYTEEAQRKSKTLGIVIKVAELRRYIDEPELYFPTFVDWRGRVYMRSSINPQNVDAIKGCLQLAEGKRLGERGLFWLKVHVANCCGYDKHDPALRVQWVDANMDELMECLHNPLDCDWPEPDTAFTAYQALRELSNALELDNPEDYVTHITVAMDATCSGLQHFSALLRDEVGGKYTNLTDDGADQKADIYRKVSEVAMELLPSSTDKPELVAQWEDWGITRSMAKKPVMTYVYGSTLKSTMDDVALNMSLEGKGAILDEDGMTLYSQHALSVPVAKALRNGVELTVPAAKAGMDFFKAAVRASNEPLRWVSPVGMPVLNWVEKSNQKQVHIRSMGIKAVIVAFDTSEYNKSGAASGISPNFTHSNDGAHLCMTINAADCSIIPIHDSFATHPCDVDEMHRALRTTFVGMYSEDLLEQFVQYNSIKIEKPEVGNLNISEVLTSRFMFT